MNVLEGLITSGRIVDIMLLVVAVEVLLITLYRFSRGGGIALLPLLANIGAGGSLMLALRATLTDHEWPTIAAFLVASMVFHIIDLCMRWQSPAIEQPVR